MNRTRSFLHAAYLSPRWGVGCLDNCQGTPRIYPVIHNFRSYPEAVLLSLRDVSVCVVGSAPELLESRNGAFIDSHDVVIRMNRMPACEHRSTHGVRTSVLTAGRIAPHIQFANCRVPDCVWWLKQTVRGDRDRHNAMHEPLLRNVGLWRLLNDDPGLAGVRLAVDELMIRDDSWRIAAHYPESDGLLVLERR